MKRDFPFNRIPRPNFRPRTTEIRKIGATDQLSVCVIGTEVHGFGLHWDKDHTAPCRENRKECPLCERQVPWKWNGYLHVHEQKVNEHYFIEMTEYAFERLLKIQGKRENLRGLILLVFRERKTIRAPLMFQLLGEVPAAKLVNVKERTPEETLAKIWKL